MNMKKIFKIINKLTKKLNHLFYLKIEDKVAVIELENFNYLSTDKNIIKFQEFKESDTFLNYNKINNDKKRITNRMKKATPYVAVLNHTIIAWLWITENAREKEGAKPFYYKVIPGKKNAYIFDTYVLPEHRNNQVITNLFMNMLKNIKKKGFLLAFLTFDKTNKPMKIIINKLGFKIIGQLSYKKILFYKKQNIEINNYENRINIKY